MNNRKPLVIVGGAVQQLPDGDTLDAYVEKAFMSLHVTTNANALTAVLSATGPMWWRPTATNGSPVTATIANDLSITIPSGATLGMANGVSTRLVFLVAYNGGSPVLCVANLSGGINLLETQLISPTTISASSNSASVIYSASAVSANSPFRIAGFAVVSEATAGTWATDPTSVIGAGGLGLLMMFSPGFSQAWQDVTASRALGTTYYNTTGREIKVGVLTGASSAHSVSATVTPTGGGSPVTIQGSSYPNAGTNAAIVFSVPVAYAYVVNGSGTSPTLSSWSEER